MSASREMPKYKCHKEVWALKIKSFAHTEPAPHNDWDGNWALVPEDSQYLPIIVSDEWIKKHWPENGYLVVYKDGYKSFSPASEFEDGYSLID